MATVFAWICLGFGGYGLLRGLRAFLRGIRSRKWPSTQGTVRKSKWTEGTDSDNETTWRLDVEYAYQVGGKKFRGTRVHFGLPARMSWIRTRPEDADDAPRTGDRVTVVYNPSFPSVSALRRGAHPFAFVPMILGGFLFTVALIALVR